MVPPGGALIATSAADFNLNGMGAPDVAFGESGYLVVWRHGSTGGDVFRGTRVSLQGDVLDPGGFVIDEAPQAYQSALPLSWGANAQRHPRVSFDGHHFIVGWQDRRDHAVGGKDAIFAARVAANGQVLDERGVRIVTAEGAPTLVSAGPSTFVLWNAEPDDNGLGNVLGVRVTPSLEVLDAKPREIAESSYNGLPVADDVDGVALVPLDEMVRMSPEGEVRKSPRSVRRVSAPRARSSSLTGSFCPSPSTRQARSRWPMGAGSTSSRGSAARRAPASRGWRASGSAQPARSWIRSRCTSLRKRSRAPGPRCPSTRYSTASGSSWPGSARIPRIGARLTSWVPRSRRTAP